MLWPQEMVLTNKHTQEFFSLDFIAISKKLFN
jgi:hypothetical protein